MALVVAAPARAPPATTTTRGAAGRAGATCTRSASPAGRTRSSARTPAWTTRRRPTCEAAASGDLPPHVVGALWWDRGRGVEQIADLVGRRDGAHRRPVPRDQRQDDAGRRGRERHGRDARAVPRPLRPRDRQQRPLLRRRRRRCRDARRRARRRGLPGARARDRRPGRPRGARRLRARHRRRRRPAPPHRAPPADPPRRRAAVRRARRRRQHAGAVGLPRRPDGRADAAVPGRGAVGVAVPVRRPAPRRRPAGRGQRLAGQHPRPAGGDPRRGQPHGVRRAGPAGTEPFLPEQALDLETAFAAYTSGVRVGEPPRRRRGARAGRGRRPRGARPGPVRRAAGGDRRDPRGVHLDRRRARLTRPESARCRITTERFGGSSPTDSVAARRLGT